MSHMSAALERSRHDQCLPVYGHRLGSQGLDLPASDDKQCDGRHGAAALVISKLPSGSLE